MVLDISARGKVQLCAVSSPRREGLKHSPMTTTYKDVTGCLQKSAACVIKLITGKFSRWQILIGTISENYN